MPPPELAWINSRDPAAINAVARAKALHAGNVHHAETHRGWRGGDVYRGLSKPEVDHLLPRLARAQTAEDEQGMWDYEPQSAIDVLQASTRATVLSINEAARVIAAAAAPVRQLITLNIIYQLGRAQAEAVAVEQGRPPPPHPPYPQLPPARQYPPYQYPRGGPPGDPPGGPPRPHGGPPRPPRAPYPRPSTPPSADDDATDATDMLSKGLSPETETTVGDADNTSSSWFPPPPPSAQQEFLDFQSVRPAINQQTLAHNSATAPRRGESRRDIDADPILAEVRDVLNTFAHDGDQTFIANAIVALRNVRHNVPEGIEQLRKLLHIVAKSAKHGVTKVGNRALQLRQRLLRTPIAPPMEQRVQKPRSGSPGNAPSLGTIDSRSQHINGELGLGVLAPTREEYDYVAQPPRSARQSRGRKGSNAETAAAAPPAAALQRQIQDGVDSGSGPVLAETLRNAGDQLHVGPTFSDSLMSAVSRWAATMSSAVSTTPEAAITALTNEGPANPSIGNRAGEPLTPQRPRRQQDTEPSTAALPPPLPSSPPPFSPYHPQFTPIKPHNGRESRLLPPSREDEGPPPGGQPPGGPPSDYTADEQEADNLGREWFDAREAYRALGLGHDALPNPRGDAANKAIEEFIKKFPYSGSRRQIPRKIRTILGNYGLKVEQLRSLGGRKPRKHRHGGSKMSNKKLSATKSFLKGMRAVTSVLHPTKNPYHAKGTNPYHKEALSLSIKPKDINKLFAREKRLEKREERLLRNKYSMFTDYKPRWSKRWGFHQPTSSGNTFKPLAREVIDAVTGHAVGALPAPAVNNVANLLALKFGPAPPQRQGMGGKRHAKKRHHRRSSVKALSQPKRKKHATRMRFL